MSSEVESELWSEFEPMRKRSLSPKAGSQPSLKRLSKICFNRFKERQFKTFRRALHSYANYASDSVVVGSYVYVDSKEWDVDVFDFEGHRLTKLDIQQQKLITLVELNQKYICISASYYVFLFALKDFCPIKHFETTKSVYSFFQLDPNTCAFGERAGYLEMLDIMSLKVKSTQQIDQKYDIYDMLSPIEDN